MTIILVRHGEVDPSQKGLCYGASDVALSPRGRERSLAAAVDLRAMLPALVCHSGLSRTRVLAAAVAGDDVPLVEDAKLRERDFGRWEGRSWDAIYRDDPHFHNLIHEPDTYRPPGGETTTEMQRRAVAWLESLPPERPVIAISHSGPIAALAGACLGLHARDWTDWIVAPLDRVVLDAETVTRVRFATGERS